MSEQFYTTAEVAKKLKLSRIAVFKMIRDGRLQAAQPGRSYHIPASALEEVLGNVLSPDRAHWTMWLAEKISREFGSALERMGQE
jgi:excisionase family DNA binding protein